MSRDNRNRYISKEVGERWLNGRFYDAYNLLGAHPKKTDGNDGVRFAVWAPHAERVSAVGTFNGWDGEANPMDKDGETGLWTTFIPGVEPGALYKYEIKSSGEEPARLKTDPYAFNMEVRPKTASRVYDLDGFDWNDSGWMEQRESLHSYERPLSIYEVHLGSWKKDRDSGLEYLGYGQLADELVPYVKEMGFSHIELMPVSEHPYDPSWGYQVTGYFAPTSRFGEPKEFMQFVDTCHRNGLGVIMDWVPGHFPKDEQGLQMFDGTPLYEYGDPLKREHKEWGTYIFDYGKPGVLNFLISNAVYWCDKFHIDGIRVDAVASMLYLDYGKEEDEWKPNRYGGNEHLEAVRFLRQMNRVLQRRYPDVLTIAEESTAWPGVTESPEKEGLGFDYKWNMGWMNDTLSYLQMKPGERKGQGDKITFPAEYATSERFILPLSHDEVVHLKKPLLLKSHGTEEVQFANLRLLYTYLITHPGKLLLFMGGEFAQKSEWSESESLEWHLLDREPHQGVQKLVRDLLALYRKEPALYRRDNDPDGFEWVDLDRKRPSFFAFMRKSGRPGEHLLSALNFSEQSITDWKPSIFSNTDYRVIFNSDSVYYGGNNKGGIDKGDGMQKGTLPPFSAQILKPVK